METRVFLKYFVRGCSAFVKTGLRVISRFCYALEQEC